MEIIVVVGMMLCFTFFGMCVILKVIHQQYLDRKPRHVDADITMGDKVARMRKTYGDMLKRLSK
jgi:hypothetical protein